MPIRDRSGDREPRLSRRERREITVEDLADEIEDLHGSMEELHEKIDALTAKAAEGDGLAKFAATPMGAQVLERALGMSKHLETLLGTLTQKAADRIGGGKAE